MTVMSDLQAAQRLELSYVSDRVPTEYIGGTVQRVEVGAHRGHCVSSDGLGRPAFGTMDGSDRTRLTNE